MTDTVIDRIANKIINVITGLRIIGNDTKEARIAIGEWQNSLPQFRQDIRQIMREMVGLESKTITLETEMRSIFRRLAETGEVFDHAITGATDVTSLASYWRILISGDPDFLSEAILAASNKTILEAIDKIGPEKVEVIRQCLSTK